MYKSSSTSKFSTHQKFQFLFYFSPNKKLTSTFFLKKMTSHGEEIEDEQISRIEKGNCKDSQGGMETAICSSPSIVCLTQKVTNKINYLFYFIVNNDYKYFVTTLLIFLYIIKLITVDSRDDWNLFHNILWMWSSGSECLVRRNNNISRDLCDLGSHCYGHDLLYWSHFRCTF